MIPGSLVIVVLTAFTYIRLFPFPMLNRHIAGQFDDTDDGTDF